jgi:hypothetical protein
MKKFVKLSLAAAVATAGLTSANAGSLEEMIKGVEVSGTAVLRYNDYQNDATNDSTSTNYQKLAVDVVSPVNDTLTFGATFVANSGFAGQVSNNTDTTDDQVELSALNFTYTGVANTTIIAGKQAVNTPWTVAADSDGATHNGTGIVAVNTSTPVTLIGAYLNQTNFGDTVVATEAGASSIVIGAKTSIEGFNLEAMYADQENALDSYTLAASTKFSSNDVNFGLSVRHTNLQVDGATTENKLTKAKLTAKAGNYGAFIAYGVTGKNGGAVAYDASAKTAMEGWNTNLSGQADASYLQTGVNAQVLPTFNVALNYFDREGKTTADDASELYTQLTWKPSKNFYTYLRYGFDIEIAGVDQNRGRIQAEYKF